MKLAPLLVLAIAIPTWVVEGQMTYNSLSVFWISANFKYSQCPFQNRKRSRRMHIPAYNAHKPQSSPRQSSPRDNPCSHSPRPDSRSPMSHPHSASTGFHLGRVSRRRYCAGGQRLWRRDAAPIAPLRRRDAGPRLGRGDGLRCAWRRLDVLLWMDRQSKGCHGRRFSITLVVDLEGFALRRGDLWGGLGMMLCLVMRSRRRVRFGGGKRLLDGHGTKSERLVEVVGR